MYQMEQELQAFVVDNGTSTMRSGQAASGGERPTHVFDTRIIIDSGSVDESTTVRVGGKRSRDVANNEDTIGEESKADGFKMYMGNEVPPPPSNNTSSHNANTLSYNYPIQNGSITDWDQIEALWSYTFQHNNIDPIERPMLMTECPFNARENRELACQIMFEVFNVPAFYLTLPAVLALYSKGKQSGILVESGFQSTYCVPVFEGYTLTHAINKIDIGGDDITKMLARLIDTPNSNNGSCCSSIYSTMMSAINTRDNDYVSAINTLKEKYCYTAMDFAEEEKMLMSRTGKSSDNKENRQAEDVLNSTQLPDGTNINISDQQRYTAPECLFDTALIRQHASAWDKHTLLDGEGIHKIAYYSIMKCDVGLHKEMFANIVTNGGNTLFRHWTDRLNKEIVNLGATTNRVRVDAAPHGLNSVWVGGSILSSLTTFERMWVAKHEYDDEGPYSIHRKCIQ
jgi:actin-related protein